MFGEPHLRNGNNLIWSSKGLYEEYRQLDECRIIAIVDDEDVVIDIIVEGDLDTFRKIEDHALLNRN